MLITSVIEKVMAFFLVFTLTFANFALVTKSYASTLFTSVFSSSSNTESENVEFDAYFEDTGQVKTYSGISALNAESVNLNLTLSVQESDYVKNAKIAIRENQENSGLNFKIANQLNEANYQYLKSFESNVLTLKQVPGNSHVDLQIPLVFENEEFIKLDKLSKDFSVELTGIYVNCKGEESKIFRTIPLKLTWEDNREIKLSSEVTKYVPIENGVILQTLVKVDMSSNLSGAVKSNNLEIEVPSLDGGTIEKVDVIARSTKGTNGKTAENVEFTEENWKFENEILSINIDNNPNKDDMYYSSSGVDEYLITYTIKNVVLKEQNITSNIKATVTTYGIKPIENKVEQTFEYKLSDKIGNLVSYEVQSDTENISKGYMYYSYLNNYFNQKEIEYNLKQIVNISNSDLVEEINIEDNTNYYIDKENNSYDLEDLYYKTITIPKENFDKILGENGNIEIQRTDGSILATITQNTEKDKNGNYVYKFNQSYHDKVKIKVSNPIADGDLILNLSKVQKQSKYEKNLYKHFDKMILNYSSKTKYINNENLEDEEIKNIEIKLDDTQTKSELELSTNNISIIEPTNIEMRIKLNNEKIESDIYGNSIFEILLPEYIKNIEINDYNIVYNQGLQLTNVEKDYTDEGRIILRATLEGIQKGLSPGIIAGGTNIIINTTVEVNEPIPKMEKEMRFTYINNEATNYYNNGEQNLLVKYLSPKGVISINSLKNYNDSEKLFTVNEGAKKSTIATYSNSINPTMEIMVMNNNTDKISNISIIGRIPTTGTKDILNNEDLGNSIESILTSKIVSNNNTNFKIYYSPNGDATNDLNDIANEWSEELDLNLVKSYLIVPEDENYELDVSQILKFSYEFNIPENLDYNQNLYGIFGTYYTKTIESEVQSEISISDKIGLDTGIRPELEIETKIDSGQTVVEAEEFTITSKVTNTGDEDLEDVMLKIPIPNGTTKSYWIATNDEILVSEEENNILYKIPKIDKGKSIEVSLKVKVNELTSEESLNITSSVIAKNLSKEISSESQEVKIAKTKLKLFIENKADTQQISIKENETSSFKVVLRNISDEDLSNIKVKLHIDDKIKPMNLFIADPTTGEIEEQTMFNKTDDYILINIDKLESQKSKYIAVNIKTNNLPEKSKLEKSYIYAKAECKGLDTIQSDSIEYSIGKPIVTISQTTTSPTYIKSGEDVEYEFIIKNEGTYSTGEIEFENIIPQNVLVKRIETNSNIENLSNNENVKKKLVLKALEEANIKIVCTTLQSSSSEYTITNKAILTSDIFGKIESNEITITVEDSQALAKARYKESKRNRNLEENFQNNSISTNEQSKDSNEKVEEVNTTKLIGYVWVDENANGARDKDEKALASTKVMLLEADTGQKIDTVTTDSKGKYIFNIKSSGDYIVVFEYDSRRYTLSAYQKDGVPQNNNSDVISTQIKENGILKDRSSYRSYYDFKRNKIQY